jgi:hypothetical protein
VILFRYWTILHSCQRATLEVLEKIAYTWQSLLYRGRADMMSLESATQIMRLATYGRLVSPDPKPPDPRQTELDLRGGKWRPRKVTLTVS